ncbi:MAG: hypothetical protein OEV85_07620 [Candidatus Thorarchaeota archaeon]|nr:hypothetical protein [Candidatus Thorarchaeota archaeon]
MSIMKRESRFRPKSEPMTSNNLGMIRLLSLFFISFMLVAPIILSSLSPTSTSYLEEGAGFIPSQSLLHYSLPGASNIQITTGTVQGYQGLAYVIDDEDRLYFVDILNDVSFDIALPTGDQGLGSGIVGYDVDNDGDSEFLIRNYVNPQYYILVVDIDDATVLQYPIPFNYPAAVGFGNFNGDAFPDVVIKNTNNNDNFMTLDLTSNVTIGLFNVDYSYVDIVVGKFASPTEDSIALANQAGTTSHRNLTLVAANGTQLDYTMLSAAVQDMVTFDWLGGLEEIATIQSNGDLVVYSGPTLAPSFAPVNVDPLVSSYRTIQTGDFNLNPQDDLVIISRNQEKAYFRDGNLGFAIRETSGIYLSSIKRQDVGRMDSDELDDLATGTMDGGLGIIRGADGKRAYTEYLIDVRSVSSSYQIEAIDANFDSRVDVICRVLGDVYLLLSDSTPPDVLQLPIDPAHPTILDDYVTVKVQIDEASEIEYADIFMRVGGSGIWVQPQEEMYASHSEGLYYAFIGNLQSGIYEYYMEFQDTYLNTMNLGNSTHPLNFTVAGHFVWQVDRSSTDYVTSRAHQSDLGNLSDGQKVIYTIEKEMGVEDLTLTQYSSSGTVLDTVTIVNTGNVWEYFEVYTAMLDGDNVADIIILDYYYKSGSFLGYHVFHGNDLSLIDEGICPFPYKSFNYLGVIDDDGDGNQELLLVSDTTPLSLIKMDSDASWSKVDLVGVDVPRSYSVINSPTAGDGYIAILRSNLEIDIHNAGDLSFIRSLDVGLSAYSDQVPVGLWSRYDSFNNREEFVAAVNYWNGSDPTGRIFIFDSTTTNVNDTPYYAIPHQDIEYVFAHNTGGSSTDELFILLSSGELLLTSADISLSTLWVTPITSATPLSATVADFDGDNQDEFVLFTDQDERLTSVSFGGEVEWTVKVGEVRNPLVIGNIDMVPGVEIATYPFASINRMILGAVRNLDSSYLLDVSMSYSSTDLIQGESVQVNVTVLNIYGEVIDDANVFVTSHYFVPEGPSANTYGFYYWEGAGKYSAVLDVSWPIGTVSLSIAVDNGFYHLFNMFYSDVFIVRSELHVDLQVPDIVQQGANTSFRAIVFDNRGGVVEGATVTISIDSVVYATTAIEKSHILDIPEVQLEAGIHVVVARANHPYALAVGMIAKAFIVQVLTENLVISTNFPATVQQDEPLDAWFNITDAYGHPIISAVVTLRSGPKVFALIESSTNLGSYRFTHSMNLGIGDHSFDLNVDTPNIVGPPATVISFEVYGELEPNVFYETRVEGGSMFEVHVFVKDKYGPVFIGTSVTIEINGTRYTQINSAGDPDYNLTMLADFLMGPNNFTIYVNATYASPWMEIFRIRAYTDASASAAIVSTNGWTILQGDRTRLELTLRDWLDRPVSGATVSFYVKALAYNLIEITPGFYAVNVSTVGWAPGKYEYTAAVNHEDIQTGDPIRGNITVLGVLEFFVDFNTEIPTQGDSLLISVSVIDAYGNPVPGLEVYITIMNMPTMRAEETDLVGLYIVFIEHLPITEGYGTKDILVMASGEFVQSSETTDTFYLYVANPDIGVMDAQTVASFAGISFAVSLIGMFIYFRISPSLRRTGTSKEELRKSVKRMDRLYLMIVFASALGILTSWGFNSIGDYAGALILTVALLGASVLLYGLWLYRDAVSAVMIRGTLSRKRMFAGLWHLFFVPVVIIMILNYGTEIDWFKANMIDQAFEVAGISIPSIMTTIFVAYVSSILVVVVNLYREVSSGLKKLKKMQDANTPGPIIEDEKDTMINRYSSSIRIKFLMFLVVVGAAAVTTMDFLQSYELGVIVLMPVAFLVVIPFISSKIVQAVNRASNIRVRKDKDPVVSDSTTMEEGASDMDIDSIEEKEIEIEPSEDITELESDEDE